MSFTPLTSGSRADAVREQLLAAITHGEFRPGDKLPAESALVAQFGVSRVSIREALRTLKVLGIIDVRHGLGSFVARGPGERYLEPFASWLQVYRDEVTDLSKVRGAMDELAAAEAASTEDRPRIAPIVDAHTQFEIASEASASDVEALVELDVAFHLAVAEASGSALLTRLLTELNMLFNESRRAAFSIPGRARQSATEHGLIVDAIKAGDPERARQATSQHLLSTRQTFTDPAFLERLAEVADAATDASTGSTTGSSSNNRE